MFDFIRSWRDRRALEQASIPESQWTSAFDSLPLLDNLDPADRQRLRELATLFIHHKSIEGAHGLVITRSMALIIALQACLPVLSLGLQHYDGWSSVIVYPSGFVPERVVRDEYGVEHHLRSELAGEAWQQGPVILSWDETEYAGFVDGCNLVIHEFAHKLDMQNGEANGFPPLQRHMDIEAWTHAFSTAFKDFQQRCQRGEHIGIDYYASTSPAEFFAVLSEIFFERPDLLCRHYAGIYQQMSQYYQQRPLDRQRN